MTTTTTELYGRRKVEGGSTRNKRPRGVQRFPDYHPRLVAVAGWRGAMPLPRTSPATSLGVITTELRDGLARARPQVARVVDEALHGR